MASSMTRPAPPGGPTSADFNTAISELAAQARKEDQQAVEDARKRAKATSFRKFVRFGVALIVVQLVCLGFLYLRARPPQTATPQRANVVIRNDCPGTAYRTYWKVVQYMKDHGQPPANLGELIGKYVDKPPTDPVSGKPLRYTTDGKNFTVRCPG